MKRLLSGLMAMLVILSLCAGCGEPAPTTGSTPPAPTTTTTTVPPVPKIDYTNASVVLYTANVRGDLRVFSQIAGARAHYEALGATVYLVDAGNYLQGSAYTATDMGLAAYYLMEAVGYDVLGMGVYDFAYGDATLGYAAHGDLIHYYTQAELYRGAAEMTYQKNAPWAKKPVYATRAAKGPASFQVVCSNLRMEETNSGYYAFESSTVLGTELRVGFISCLAENGMELLTEESMQGYLPCEVVAPECDVLVSFGSDLGDIAIELPEDGSMLVGAYVIDHTTQAITYESVELGKTNETVDAWIKALPLETVVGTAAVDLIGSHLANRNGQTNLGTLVADALKWYGENKLEGIEYPVIGLFNGGNCTGFLYSGEITKLDIRNAIHCSQKGVGVVYMTGEEILEMLEAATQREHCPGWAQVSGIDYQVDITKAYDFGAAYGLYYKANSVNRVSVISEGFDPNATYAVVADQLLLEGEDTYYMLKDRPLAVQDGSGTDLCRILMMYIQEALAGQISG